MELTFGGGGGEVPVVVVESGEPTHVLDAVCVDGLEVAVVLKVEELAVLQTLAVPDGCGDVSLARLECI